MECRKILARAFGACLLLAVGAGAASAEDAAEQTAIALMDRAQASDAGYEIVSSLTTEIGPRLGGSPAEARARAWAVDLLNAYGFENVRIEPFEIPYWERGEIDVSVVGPNAQPLAATALGFSVGTPRRGIEAEIVEFATYDDLKALPEEALAGKIAFINDPMPRTQDGSSYGPAVAKRRDGWAEASKRGAKALLIRSVGTGSDRFPHTGGTRRPDQIPDVKPIPAAALATTDADLLHRLIARGAPAPKLRFRMTSRLAGTRPSGNVVAEIEGRERPEEIVLLGAHLDSWDLGTGAIDDGFGVGVVVAAAKLIRDLPTRPRRTVRVVLFGTEEFGLLGGEAYAARHEAALAQHVVGVESDFGAGPIWRFDSRGGAEDQDDIAQIARVLKRLNINYGNNDAWGGPDLIPMRDLGMPVVTLYQDGSDYFDWHHTANDMLERIDPISMRSNVAAYAAFAYLAAERDMNFRADAD